MVELLISMMIFFMIIGAIIALETTDLLSAVISIGAIGTVASICYLLLGAPDIASTQLVVEVLTIIILIRATIRHDLITIDGDREFFGLTITLALVFVLLLFGIKAFNNLFEFGNSAISQLAEAPSNRYLVCGFQETGANNILSAILFDYRGLDTFGQLCVLFAGIWGAFAIMRVQSRKKKTGKGDSNEDR
ncbi:MAG: hydrogenase subunit MbhD domain-containing protein [Candidatus Ratteibacteria bacterium]